MSGPQLCLQLSPLSEMTAAAAAACDQIKVLSWLRERRCPLGTRTFRAAALCGELDTLRWLALRGCPLDSSVCKAAAFGVHLQVLQRLRLAVGCEWDLQTVLSASYGGHVEVLRRTLDNDWPVDPYHSAVLTNDNNLVLFQVQVRAGAPPGPS